MKKVSPGKIIYLALVMLFLYLPIFTLMVLSFNRGKSIEAWMGFSLKWYREMFQNGEILSALLNTFAIAFLSSLIATVIGTAASVALSKMPERKKNFYMGLNNIPLLNADIVTGISIMMSFVLFGISLSYGTVLFAHITFSIPYVVLSVLPRLKKSDGSIYEAALDLGASKGYAFFKVVLPDIMPGIIAGFLLTFTMSVDDFVITHFTRGTGLNTISTLIYSQVKVGIRPTLYALSTIIFAIVLVILVAVNILQNRKKTRSDKSISKRTKHRELRRAGVRLKPIMAGALITALTLSCVVYLTTDRNIGEKGQVYIYSFGDYFDTRIIKEFEKETGYDIIVDYFDTNEEMYPVIKNQTQSYDLITASDYMIERMTGEGLLDKIDWNNVPNARNITEMGWNLTEKFDPRREYSMPHVFGIYGIMYNKNVVNLDGQDVSWNILWDERYRDEIVMPNSIREGFMIAGKAMGYSMNTESEEELATMSDYLIAQKPLVYSYANDYARDLAVSGSVGLAVVNSGEVLYSIANNSDLGFVIPSEGSELWMDSWVIPKGAKNKEGAEAFLNFLTGGETAKENFEYLTYPIPNEALLSDDYGIEDEDLRRALFTYSGSYRLSDSEIFTLSEKIFASSETLSNLRPEVSDLYSLYWKRVKS